LISLTLSLCVWTTTSGAQQAWTAGIPQRTDNGGGLLGGTMFGQIRQAAAPSNPVRKGMVVGAVIGAGLLVSYVVLEDMLGGDLLEVENAENGITPQRILGYTGVGIVVGAAIGGTIGYLRRDRAALSSRQRPVPRTGRSAASLPSAFSAGLSLEPAGAAPEATRRVVAAGAR
jgi:hypothetical protein